MVRKKRGHDGGVDEDGAETEIHVPAKNGPGGRWMNNRRRMNNGEKRMTASWGPWGQCVDEESKYHDWREVHLSSFYQEQSVTIGRNRIMGSWGGVYVSAMCRPNIMIMAVKLERKSLVHVIFSRFFVVFSTKSERNRMERRCGRTRGIIGAC